MQGVGDKNLSVLFVCLGNICRSPMAEGAFRAAAARHALDCEVDSAGTASYHIGSQPDLRAIAIARANGVEIADQSARQIERNDFFRFTHIFAMDEANLAGIKAQAPRDGTARVALLTAALQGKQAKPIADPYYGDDALFASVWDEVSEAAEALAAHFAQVGVDLRL